MMMMMMMMMGSVSFLIWNSTMFVEGRPFGVGV